MAECSLFLEREPWGLEDEVKKDLPWDPPESWAQSKSRTVLKPPLLSGNKFKTFHPAQSSSYILPARWLVSMWPRVPFPPPFLGTLQPDSPLASYALRCGFSQAFHARET